MHVVLDSAALALQHLEELLRREVRLAPVSRGHTVAEELILRHGARALDDLAYDVNPAEDLVRIECRSVLCERNVVHACGDWGVRVEPLEGTDECCRVFRQRKFGDE